MNKRLKAAYVVNAIQAALAAAVTVIGWSFDSPITVAVGGVFLIEATLWRGLRGPRQ
jgi:uncharacterized membrane protein